MDFVMLAAQELRAKYPHRSGSAFITCLLMENKLSVDLWPIQTQKVSGCLWKNGEEWTIVLNSRQNPQRKLFTLAHELGHYFLHRHVKAQFFCNVSSTKLALSIEREANQFAAELLMPAEQVLFCVKKYASSSRAARHFGVSEEAIHYRLESLSTSNSH